MKINIHLENDQVDQIVAEALRETYDNVAGATNYGTPEEYLSMVSALEIVYHYYTGKSLK